MDLDHARVGALHLADAHGGPMRAVEAVEAAAGAGLVGDRFHGSRHRHLSMVSADALTRAAEDLGRPIAPGLTRRNVTISQGKVPTEPGQRLWLGPVLAEVVRRASPCRRMDEELGPGAKTALHDRGGAVCRLLTSGPIRIGDPVEPHAGVRVTVHGRVQGVFFRASTQDVARNAGVHGWVRNLADGGVEAHLEGPSRAVAGVQAWMEAGGPEGARVSDSEVVPAEPGDVRPFEILRSERR